MSQIRTNVNDLNTSITVNSRDGWGRKLAVKWLSENVWRRCVAGHYNHVQGTNAGELVNPPTTAAGAPAIPNRNWDVVAGVAGLRLTVAGFSLLLNAYVGKNLGPLLGDLLQFPVTNDVNEWGGWAQLGYNITHHLNVWALGGTSRPKVSDVDAAGGGRAANSVIGGMIRYQDGGFALGPEFYHVIARDVTATGAGAPSGPGAPNGTINVNQAMLSGAYFF